MSPGEESDHEEIVQKPPPDMCDNCAKSAAKYKCPACLVRSCSLSCVKDHKMRTNCSGIRDKTSYVSVKKFTEHELASDFCFLEEASRLADNAARDMDRLPGGNPHVHKNQTHGRQFSVREQHLIRSCKSRRISLKLMSKGMKRHELNKSIYHLKSKEMQWTVEWIFQRGALPSISIIQNNVKESCQIHECLTDLLSASTSSIPATKLCELNDFNLSALDSIFVYLRRENVPANDRLYIKLEKGEKLSTVLEGKTLVEYPTFLVSLTELAAEMIFNASSSSKDVAIDPLVE